MPGPYRTDIEGQVGKLQDDVTKLAEAFRDHINKSHAARARELQKLADDPFTKRTLQMRRGLRLAILPFLLVAGCVVAGSLISDTSTVRALAYGAIAFMSCMAMIAGLLILTLFT